ncbi:MAG: GTPase ObgE [Candidatus Paceibacterota bacterium]
MVDELRIKVRAGRGGDGRVAFAKGRGSKGVTGGDGGNGGSVYMEAVSDLSVLRNYRFKKAFEAENGGDGGTKKLKGKNGEDLIIKVPVGTIAHNLDTKEDIEVLEVGEKVRLAKGGKGGRGNWHFRTAERQAPDFAEKGRSEEEFEYYIELRLIADAGFIGLPSAGKSSLLNALTEATAKVASYHFTTLEANLGVFYPTNSKAVQTILADIPGLIEGAHKGKGLGDKFLRHIKRTRYLFHCISAESENMKKDYKTIWDELKSFDKELSQKNECIILTKIDLISDKEKEKRIKELKKLNPNVICTSVETEDGLEEIQKFIKETIS